MAHKSEYSDNFRKNAINLLSINCPICNNYFPLTKIETMFLCNHKCCLNCLKAYYRVNVKQIQDSQSLHGLTCFQAVHKIEDDMSMNFFTWLNRKVC